MDAPEKVVGEFVMGGRLEGCHSATLRIQPGHDVLDRAILSAGVHALEHDEQGAVRVRIETLLKSVKFCDEFRCMCSGLFPPDPFCCTFLCRRGHTCPTSVSHPA